ncbi:hypothetical protein LUZ60_010635 [Juncus effusus]|nr:hypothetical protein LUZ60_010635 [Juncus effusus]
MATMKAKWFLFYLFSVSLLSICASTDTISSDFSLSGKQQKLVSSQGKFALGFYQPAGNYSEYWYIAIWYNTISLQTSVFVANRNYPITDPDTSVLSISNTGNLVLLNGPKTEVWSTNITNIPSFEKTEAVLLNSGNLVLRYVSNTSNILWQSIDHPTNTWLPGAKLGLNKVTGVSQRLLSWKSSTNPSDGISSLELYPNDNKYIIQWNNSYTYWNSGPFSPTEKNFVLFPEMTENYIYNFTYVNDDNESYFIYSVKPISNITSRFIMDYTGQLKQLAWVESVQDWTLIWSQPQQCDVYAFCGPNGSCNGAQLPYCNCIKGFSAKSMKDFDFEDYSDGCVRNTRLQCNTTYPTKLKPDKFFTMYNMYYPNNGQSKQVGSVQECESTCLKDCSCTAYSYQNICTLWFGDLLSLQDGYTGNDGGTLYLRLAASEFPSGKNHKELVIGVVIGCIAFVFLCAIACFVVLRSKKDFSGPSQFAEEPEDWKNFELPLFTFDYLASVTNNFGISNKLGEGGFGLVYKGSLATGEEIAVKRLSATSGQGIREFKNEVILIAKLQHRNLVKLLGCCIQGDERLLVYEYLPNKSLDAFLFDPSKRRLLDWKTRFNIIEGIARGLLYLHKDSRLRVVHRDLKASNILLDKEMEPKISDFGMARIFDGDQKQENTNRVVGTLGYMSPEYAMEGIFSLKSDVYSFGILIMEIITGDKNSSFHNKDDSWTVNIVGYVFKMWSEGKSVGLIDPTLIPSCSIPEALRCIHVALLCVEELAHDRPDISSVIKMLISEDPNLPLPRRPAFTSFGYLSGHSALKSKLMSACDVTITRLEGR